VIVVWMRGKVGSVSNKAVGGNMVFDNLFTLVVSYMSCNVLWFIVVFIVCYVYSMLNLYVNIVWYFVLVCIVVYYIRLLY
jgi:hypothetical protein